MSIKERRYLPFYVFTLAAIVVLLLPKALQYGSFMDGCQYACVSMNMSEGYGSFWFPKVTQTWWQQHTNNFMEHPPLFYFLESQFFKVFNHSFYTEGIFCFTIALLSTLFIQGIWQIISIKAEINKHFGWLPVFFWISIPVCFWAFNNNMIEILVSLFVMASVYFMLRALILKKWVYINLLFSGIMIFSASLSKGLPGFFPIVGVFVFFLTVREITFLKTILYSLIIAAIPAGIYFYLFKYNQEASESLTFYIKHRLIYRINTMPSAPNRFHTLYMTFSELLPLIIISLLSLLIKAKTTREQKRFSFFFFALGLCGVLPLMITMVQNNFYFMPALVFFALGFAVALYTRISFLINLLFSKKGAFKFATGFSFLFLLAGLSYSVFMFGKDSRDHETLAEARILANSLKGQKIVSVDNEIYFDWAFQFYMYRYHGISIEPKKEYKPYFITKSENFDPKLQKVNTSSKKYLLYKWLN